MLKIISAIVICLLGSTSVNPAIADESLSVQPVPPQKISIAKIETTFAVSPTSREVDPEYVKELAIDYFSDIPVMVAICECESHFEHYRSDGTLNVSRARNKAGKRVSSATGACQILYKGHFDIWAQTAHTNITTIEGNFAQARRMYNESGTSPWDESRNCWEPKMHKYDRRVANASN